ncbi:MAG: hypothetical protein H0U74_00745 [Bradymonadaceae bacterium]|nr:hypothetical protein [Lujinxingiaceae bacterium]
MARLICLADDKNRDAHVEFESPKRKVRWRFVGPESQDVQYANFIKNTERHTYEALLANFGDDAALSQALVDTDPEFDIELVGRRVGEADRVWIRTDGSVLYSTRVLQVVFDKDGVEQGRDEFRDVEATVGEDARIPWSGRLFDVEHVVRRFALVRKLQLRHVNGLTFDFLFEIAKQLHEGNKMLLVGTGTRGNQPLIFQTNGSPYRGFLHGKIENNSYSLCLYLSNLELKGVQP